MKIIDFFLPHFDDKALQIVQFTVLHIKLTRQESGDSCWPKVYNTWPYHEHPIAVGQMPVFL